MWQLSAGIGIAAALAGWTVNDWRHEAKIKDALESAQEAAQENLDALQARLDIANGERLELATELAREQANIKVKYRTITQEVPTYVPENTDSCNYDISPDLASLLNSAARGGLRRAGSGDIAARQLLSAVPGQSTDLAGGPGDQSGYGVADGD